MIPLATDKLTGPQALARLAPLAGLAITKMTGTGNDFILVDNRERQVPLEVMPLLARAVCCRRRSVGADGLICLRTWATVEEKPEAVDFRWDFFNADGSSAEMCGNGGRCAARFALDSGMAGSQMAFATLAGPIRAQVKGGVVKLEMVPPSGSYQELSLTALERSVTLDGVNTGVPHAVVLVEDLEAAPVREMGRALRFHPHFAPAGTNVNFARAQGDQLMVRTYERGVEDETLACGTGVVASALVAGRRGLVKPPVNVRVRSGELLKVHFDPELLDRGPVFLEGEAAYVYQGVLHEQAFAWLGHQPA